MSNNRLGIDYLAFEGGGGKGVAYIGAIKALESHEILRRRTFNTSDGKKATILDSNSVKGISGTSAGAITAVLVATGYDHKFLYKMLSSKIPLTFYDDARPARCPSLSLQNNVFSPIDYTKNSRRKTLKLYDLAVTTITSEATRFFWYLLKPFFFMEPLKPFFLKDAGKHPMPYIFQKIITNPDPYLLCFLLDMGLFTGEFLRNFIEKCLKEHTGIDNITFDQFYKLSCLNGQENGIHLKIAGVCLNTREVVWFDHLGPWKHLCIADAVRISASIPGVFKPVAISVKLQKNKIDLEKCLLFIDGGVLNNTPIHAFDSFAEEDQIVTKAEATLFGGDEKPQKKIIPLNEKVLGLRLTDPSEKSIKYYDNGLTMIGGTLNLLVSQSEISQIRTVGESQQTIDLDTSGLELLEFKVGKKKLKDKCEEIYRYTDDWLTNNWKKH